MKPILRFIVPVGLALALAAPCDAGSYSLVDLGNSAHPYAINNSGLVTMTLPSQGGVVFDTSNQTTHNLGSLGGGNLTTYPYAINSNGDIVGNSNNAAGYARTFLYSGGLMTDLNAPDFFSYVTPHAINNSGQVVGQGVSSDDGTAHAVLYSAGGWTDLGTFDVFGVAEANGINDGGQIVGDYIRLASGTPDNGTAYSRAFLYSGGVMTDLGTLGGNRAFAAAINNSGDIVGWSSTPGDAAVHAFLYSGGVMHDLGTGGAHDSSAVAINTSGQVLGHLASNNPVLFRDGSAIPLWPQISISPPSIENPTVYGASWKSGPATGMNDRGQVVGYDTFSTDFSDYPRGYVLTPVIPEPSSIVLAAVGFVGLAAWGWRWRRSR